MKKFLFTNLLALILAFSVAGTHQTSAASIAPDGFYNLNSGHHDYVKSANFIFMTPQQKLAILTKDYHLVTGSKSVSVSDILNAKTNEDIEKAQISVGQLEEKYNVSITKTGEIEAGPTVESFEVLSID
ncbi:hypothetical protein [Sporosarcina ureae]|uniref:Uncharacterized protein n=1 Tax=Sporosarcina ureae TaxID=1571 RepID=A0ABN4YPP5_SPOUR|nr:hypothetical protein [Sporosarcina ureae]ARF14904.1 hypothetical protein SporoS204_12525 [Sporosarcina ureae]